MAQDAAQTGRAPRRGALAEFIRPDLQPERIAITHEALPTVGIFVAVGYSILALGHLTLLTEPAATIMAATAQLSAALGLAAAVLWRAGKLKKTWANAVMSGFFALILVNSTLHVLVMGVASEVVNIALAVALIGLFFLSIRWALLNLAAVGMCWAVTTQTVLTPVEAAHFGFFAFNCTVVGLIAFILRWRAYTRQIVMRREAEEREKALQRALRRARIAEEAEKESRAQQQFLANMSHELRTPLNAIIGFSEIVRSESFGPMGGDPVYAEYIAEIHEAGRNLLCIVNDVLDLAQVHAGGGEQTEEDVDVRVLVERMEELVRFRAQEKSLTLVFHVHSRARRVVTDGTCLKQTLMHLLDNAIRFTPAGGTVRVEAGVDDRRGKDGGHGKAGGIYFRISDTGPGMAPETLRQALIPFWQGERGSTRAFGGIGLGLPLAKEFAELLGGTLDIRSAPGQGTAATVWLPLTALATGNARHGARHGASAAPVAAHRPSDPAPMLLAGG